MDDKGRNKIMDAPGVEEAMNNLFDAIEAAVGGWGGKIKRFSIVTVSSYDGELESDVVTTGCSCTSCRISSITALARASGGRVSTVGIETAPGEAPAVH